MPIATLLPILITVVEEAPAAYEAVKKIWDLYSAKEPPTAEEQAAFDAALEKAHKAVQDL